MSDEIQDAILAILPGRDSIDAKRAHVKASRRLGHSISPEDFDAALAALSSVRFVSLENSNLKRCEPDFPEKQLEDAVQSWLFGNSLFELLALSRNDTVCQKTTLGGRSNSGIWSRPDFTIATIRRRKYDPIRHLDVIAFELKNLAGAHVGAVHEALAHTRFAHYAYLVCPRTRLQLARFSEIQRSCTEHGVGLITFSLSVSADGTPAASAFEIASPATRQTPNPDYVDQYIDDRFSGMNRDRLKSIAEAA